MVKKLTKIESEEMKVQTELRKEIVEIQKNLESYQKEGKRTKLSSAPKGWKSEKVESQHAPTTLMEVQRLRWKAAEKWRTEVDKKWKEL